MGDKVFVRDLVIYSNHGVFEEEKKLGQRLHFDIDCELDEGLSWVADDYSHAVDYQKVCMLVDEVARSRSYNLLEALSEKIVETLLDRYHFVRQVSVRVRKPGAPIPLALDHVGVEISRSRQDSDD